jgi:hypothetical protein
MGIKPPPSACDTITEGDSLLCDLATKNGVNLETVGTLIMVLNLRAIKQDAYTKQQALGVLQGFKNGISFNMRGVDLMNLAMAYVDEYPELLLVAPYISYLDTDDFVKPKDVELLNAWLDNMVKTVQ